MGKKLYDSKKNQITLISFHIPKIIMMDAGEDLCNFDRSQIVLGCYFTGFFSSHVSLVL